jgi:hypothetical protein
VLSNEVIGSEIIRVSEIIDTHSGVNRLLSQEKREYIVGGVSGSGKGQAGGKQLIGWVSERD